MGSRTRVLLVVAAAVVLVAVTAGPAGADAPATGPVRVAPAGAFHPDLSVDSLAVGYDGTARVVVHGTRSGGLTFDRFAGTAGPIGRPVTVEPFAHPDSSYRNWHEGSVAYGNGYAVASFDAAEPSGHGPEIHHRTFDMVGPSGPVSILEPGGGGFTICPDETDPTAPGTESDDAIAWNGSSFLVAKACEDGLRIYGLDTSGNAIAQAAGPGVTGGVAIASVGGGSLVVWSQGAPGSRDIRALRLDVDGLAVGSPFTVAGGAADQTDPVVAASTTGYLVGWLVPDHNGALAIRTVSGTGALGTSRTLVDEGHKQFGLQFAPGSGGTWFSAWADGRSPANSGRGGAAPRFPGGGVGAGPQRCPRDPDGQRSRRARYEPHPGGRGAQAVRPAVRTGQRRHVVLGVGRRAQPGQQRACGVR